MNNYKLNCQQRNVFLTKFLVFNIRVSRVVSLETMRRLETVFLKYWYCLGIGALSQVLVLVLVLPKILESRIDLETYFKSIGIGLGIANFSLVLETLDGKKKKKKSRELAIY